MSGTRCCTRWPTSPRCARTCMCRCSPATTTCCAAMGRHYTAARVPRARGRGARRVPRRQHDHRRDRRLSRPRTSAAFERTLEAVDAAGITRVHVFPYSPRPGTVAEGLGDRVAPPEKKRRSQVLRARSEVRSRHHRAASLGQPERVLIDKVASDRCSGYTADYTRCYLPGGARPARRAGRRGLRGAPRRRDPRQDRRRISARIRTQRSRAALGARPGGYPWTAHDGCRAGQGRHHQRHEGGREGSRRRAAAGALRAAEGGQGGRATTSWPCCAASASAGSRPPRSSATAAGPSWPTARSRRPG